MAHDDDSDDPKFDYQDPSISSADNQVIWKGSAGQIVNLGTYLLCATAILVLWVLRKMPARRAGANTNPTAVRRSFFGWISGRRAADDTAYEPIPVQP